MHGNVVGSRGCECLWLDIDSHRDEAGVAHERERYASIAQLSLQEMKQAMPETSGLAVREASL